MAKEVFWGLTTIDFEKGMWNTFNECAAVFAGCAAAALANQFVYTLLHSVHPRGKTVYNGFSLLLGALAGIGASTYAANRLTHITFSSEKALKFLVISLLIGATGGLFGKSRALIGLIASGGAWGYFGRTPLYSFSYIATFATTGYLCAQRESIHE